MATTLSRWLRRSCAYAAARNGFHFVKAAQAPLLCALALCSSSCALHKPDRDPAPPVEVPEAFSETGGNTGAPALSDKWWQSFNDKNLNALMRAALGDNLDVRAARARIEQARALAVQAGAGRYPRLTGSGLAQRGRMTVPVTPTNDLVWLRNRFALGLTTSYELDVWGRHKARAAAGELDLQVSRDEADTIVITTAASVCNVWYSLCAQRAQKALLEQQIKVSRELLELTRMRFQKGRASSLDVHEQRRQLATLLSREPLIDASIELLEHQLAILIARPPKAPVPQPDRVLPDPPGLPRPGLPADLLNRRPDVRAARRRAAAADYRLAEAIANRFPKIKLTAGMSYESSNRFEDIFNRWLWNIGGNLTQPIFEGGRLKAEADRNKARVAELRYAYGKAVLNAFREVEDALTRERHQRRHIEALDEELDQARATLERARRRYEKGLTDYLNVLTALQSLQNVQRIRLDAQRDLLLYRIQLYRALGGGWQSAAGKEEARES